MKIVNSKKEFKEMKYCNNCDVDVIPVNGKCPNCGLDFNPDIIKDNINENSNSESNFDTNERHINTRLYKRIAIIVLFAGFICGILLGNEYGICSDYLTSCSEKEFNSAVMIYCWSGTALLYILLMAIHSICYRLDLIIDKK